MAFALPRRNVANRVASGVNGREYADGSNNTFDKKSHGFSWGGRGPAPATIDTRTRANQQLENLYLDKKYPYESLGEDEIKDTFAKEHLKERFKQYKEDADRELRCEFEDWLQGNHPEYNVADHEEKKREVMMLRENENDPLPSLDATEYRQHTPWGNASLVHLPGVKDWLANEEKHRSNVEFNLARLMRYGPQNIEQAWVYFKYLVKNHRRGELCLTDGDDPPMFADNEHDARNRWYEYKGREEERTRSQWSRGADFIGDGSATIAHNKATNPTYYDNLFRGYTST